MKARELVKLTLNSKTIRRLKIFLYSLKNKDGLNLISSNIEIKGKYSGKRCFILGNGPSLKKIDFSLLSDEYTFSVNQLPRNSEYDKLKTNFHVWADNRFFNINESKEEDVELLRIMQKVSTVDNAPLVFYKVDANKMIKHFNLDKEMQIAYFSDIYIDDLEEYLENGIDITKPLPIFSTVIHYAICIAAYMGFTEIYLLGCDCTGFISTANQRMNLSEESLYAYDVTLNEKRRIEQVSALTTIEDELLWYSNLFRDYRIIGEVLKRKGIEIYNAGEGGLLECYPRVSFEQIIKHE